MLRFLRHCFSCLKNENSTSQVDSGVSWPEHDTEICGSVILKVGGRVSKTGLPSIGCRGTVKDALKVRMVSGWCVI